MFKDFLYQLSPKEWWEDHERRRMKEKANKSSSESKDEKSGLSKGKHFHNPKTVCDSQICIEITIGLQRPLLNLVYLQKKPTRRKAKPHDTITENKKQ